MLNREKNIRRIVEQIAHQEGISILEIRHEMELAIADARENPDTQENFMKLFGNRTPTPEEFILSVAKQIEKR